MLNLFCNILTLGFANFLFHAPLKTQSPFADCSSALTPNIQEPSSRCFLPLRLRFKQRRSASVNRSRCLRPQINKTSPSPKTNAIKPALNFSPPIKRSNTLGATPFGLAETKQGGYDSPLHLFFFALRDSAWQVPLPSS